MTVRAACFLVVLCAAFLPSCGYIGDPLPPALHIPMRISNLTAFQRGGNLIVRFTPDFQSTDRLTLKSLTIDLRAGPAGPPPFDVNEWASRARAIPAPAAAPEPVEVEAPVSGWSGQDVVVAARSLGPTGKPSEWSNLVVLKILEPLETPTGIRLEARAAAIHLAWSAGRPVEGSGWRVFRQAEGETEFQLVGKTTRPEWDDGDAHFGATYSYRIQKTAPAGANSEAESEPSQPVSVRYADVFAPAVPAGVTALAGVNTIEVAWPPVPAPDLRGYIVYRAAAGEAFAKLGDIVVNPSYTDREVVPGKRYRYRISSVDQLGNESEPSAPVEAAAPN